MTVSSTLTPEKALIGDAAMRLQMQECGNRLVSVWRALETRVPDGISHDQLDVALAFYAYGLTLPFYADRTAAHQVDAVVYLLMKVLPDERVGRAIHSKESYDERFASTCESLIRLGERNATAVVQSIHSDLTSTQGSHSSPAHDALQGAGDIEGASR